MQSKTKFLGFKACFAVSVLLALLTACGGIKGGIKSKLPSDATVPTGPDFLRTEVVTSGSARADGLSELVVVIHLKNSDSSPVPNYKPTYEMAAGLGVIPSACSSSDSNGVSACVVRATQPGVKRMRLTNSKVGLEKDLTFVLPVYSSSKISLISGAIPHGRTVGGFKSKMNAGATVTGAAAGTSSGYKVKFSLQGSSE